MTVNVLVFVLRVVFFHLILGTLRTDNAVVWKTLGPRVGLGRAPRTKRGKYVVKIKNAIIYTNSHRLENSKTLFTFPDKNDSKLI